MSLQTRNRNEDDLEYHINFPVPDPFEYCNKEVEQKPDKLPSSEETKSIKEMVCLKDIFREDIIAKIHRPSTEPVIFLLGWFNSKDRYLAKYSSMYNKLGYITIRYTAPPMDLFDCTQSNLKTIAGKLIKLMEDTTLSHHPIFFHNFSNHGSTLYTHISEQMECFPELPLDVVGCIFDSAPSPRKISSAFKAIFRTTSGSLCFRLLASSFICFGLCVWKAFSILSTLITGHLPSSPPWSLLQEPFRWPQLFLYSQVDDLVSSQDIELFASERQNLGIKVRMHDFKDSPHVMHYKEYPDEYRNIVDDFIKVCLQEHIQKKQSINSSKKDI